MTDKNKINCSTIKYRQGFIEVLPHIHDKCINIETWQLDPNINISKLSLTDEEIKNKHINGNTEIELNINNAELLVKLLTNAISEIKNHENA